MSQTTHLSKMTIISPGSDRMQSKTKSCRSSSAVPVGPRQPATAPDATTMTRRPAQPRPPARLDPSSTFSFAASSLRMRPAACLRPPWRPPSVPRCALPTTMMPPRHGAQRPSRPRRVRRADERAWPPSVLRGARDRRRDDLGCPFLCKLP